MQTTVVLLYWYFRNAFPYNTMYGNKLINIMYTNKIYNENLRRATVAWRASINNIIEGSRERSLFCAKSDGRLSRAQHEDRAKLTVVQRFRDFGHSLCFYSYEQVSSFTVLLKNRCHQFSYNTNVPTCVTAVTGRCGRCGWRVAWPPTIKHCSPNCLFTAELVCCN